MSICNLFESIHCNKTHHTDQRDAELHRNSPPTQNPDSFLDSAWMYCINNFPMFVFMQSHCKYLLDGELKEKKNPCDLGIGQLRHNCTADESVAVQFIIASYMYLLIVFHLNLGNLNQNDSEGLEFPESCSKFPSASLGCLFPSILLLVLRAACLFGFTQSLYDSSIMKCQLSIKPALLTL